MTPNITLSEQQKTELAIIHSGMIDLWNLNHKATYVRRVVEMKIGKLVEGLLSQEYEDTDTIMSILRLTFPESPQISGDYTDFLDNDIAQVPPFDDLEKDILSVATFLKEYEEGLR